jgi:hypothetical protein
MGTGRWIYTSARDRIGTSHLREGAGAEIPQFCQSALKAAMANDLELV